MIGWTVTQRDPAADAGLCVGLHSPDGCLLFSPGQSLDHIKADGKLWPLSFFWFLVPLSYSSGLVTDPCHLHHPVLCSYTPNPYIDFTVFPFLLFCSKGDFKPSHVLTSRPEYAPTCRLYSYFPLFWLNSEMPLHPPGLAFSVLICCSLKGIPGTMHRNTKGSCEGPQGTRLHCWLELIGDPNSGGIRGYSCVYSDTVQLPWFFLVQNTQWFLVS